MSYQHTIPGVRRAVLFGCTALATASTFATGAFAQETIDDQSNAIKEIVVTAQKRTQNQQDVPISITAVTAEGLDANRITSVTDLGTVVPNLASRETAGGAQSPAFTMRGVTSYGVVPGSDKELSIYIDGVYVASTVGSALDLPEVSQIEVLRGPQGTLFGRNATVGAISVITRDPVADFGVNQQFSVGNSRQLRSKTRVDLGSLGPFSATVSYVHDERRGDIRNAGAGTTYTFPASSGFPASLASPKYLGDKNLNSVFAAFKFEPSDNFKVVNKFNWTGNHYTPQGSSVVGVFPAALGPAGGGFLSVVLATQDTPPLLNTTGKRPSLTNNSFSLPSYARDWGNSLTAEFRASDSLSFKNVLAYRSSLVRGSNQLDGFGGLKITAALAAIPGFEGFAPIIGSPFTIFGIQQLTTSKQWSNEFQANYNSQLLTLTAGALYFHVKGESGGAPGLPNNVILSAVPFGNMAFAGAPSRATYTATSLAGYVQAEVHATSQVDLVGGLRVTKDKKSGAFLSGAGSVANIPYSDSRLSYSLGVNYKPTDDILLYAKYSTAFVAGGFSGPISYKPETAGSWEVGLKSDWFDNRFRANLAVFDVKYKNLQTAQAGITLGHPEISLAVADLGDQRARGFELETTAVPVSGVTLGAAFGFTDVKFLRLNPIISQLGVPVTLANFKPTLQPKWTSNLSAQYDTQPLFGEARLSFRVDASWRSKTRLVGYEVLRALPQYTSTNDAPATWLINGRIALERIHLPIGEGQIAIWAKNLTNDKTPTFPDNFGFVGATEFQAARTFGVDFTFNY